MDGTVDARVIAFGGSVCVIDQRDMQTHGTCLGDMQSVQVVCICNQFEWFGYDQRDSELEPDIGMCTSIGCASRE